MTSQSAHEEELHEGARPTLQVPSPPGLSERLGEHHLRYSHKPRRLVPFLLLLLTLGSTYLAGSLSWQPFHLFLPETPELGIAMRQESLRHWQQGLTYMVCVVGILFAHEMGHYVGTLIYRIPSSLPYFIPFPIAPVGTMGAVIAMQGQRANRREIFDIGIAGPIAGLILAVPIIWIGIRDLEPSTTEGLGYRYHLPIIARWMYSYLHPDATPIRELASGHANAMFMAGWVGLLITGLNMMPISQLDGGHVTYTLFGKTSRYIARLFVAAAVFYMIQTRTPIWSPMLILILFIGIDHPPTSDDRVPLGWPRTVLGYCSLLIPILCFPLKGLQPPGS